MLPQGNRAMLKLFFWVKSLPMTFTVSYGV